jgi:hypothetical protein
MIAISNQQPIGILTIAAIGAGKLDLRCRKNVPTQIALHLDPWSLAEMPFVIVHAAA